MAFVIEFLTFVKEMTHSVWWHTQFSLLSTSWNSLILEKKKGTFVQRWLTPTYFSRFLHCISTLMIPLSMWLLLYSPRHFPQCTTCSPLLQKFITRVPVKDSSVKPSELRRRLMMLCPDGIPSVFLGEDGRNCATAFPECFLGRMRISLAGLTGLTAPSRAFELWVTGSVLLFFSCHFIINTPRLSKLLKMHEGHLPWPGSKSI